MKLHSGRVVKLLNVASFSILCLLMITYGCTGKVPPATGIESAIPTGTSTELGSPQTTIQWISTPTTMPQIQVSPGIGEGIIITEQEFDVHYEDLEEPFSPGLYIVYDVLDIAEYEKNGNLNYEIWSRSLESGEKTRLIACTACPFVIQWLETDSDPSGSWRIVAAAAGTERDTDTVLLFDMVQKRTRMVSCKSDDPEKYCRISLFSGKLVVYSEDYPFIDIELSPSHWITISGEVFDTQWYAYRFFPRGEIYLFPLHNCSEDNTYSITIVGNDYNVEELPPLSGICDFDSSPLMLGKSSSSTDSQVAYVVETSTYPLTWFLFIEQRDLHNIAWIDPGDSIVVCSSDSLYTGDRDECYKINDVMAKVLPFSVEFMGDKFSWLDDHRFLWERPAGMLEGQIIGTMDLNGNVQIIYQGENIEYHVSPDGKWLLYKDDAYGLMSTEDGSTVYLPFPEDTIDVTWLLIP